MVQRHELAALVQRVLDLLPVRYGNVLEWKYLDDVPVREIAARCEVSEKAAESDQSCPRKMARSLWRSHQFVRSREPSIPRRNSTRTSLRNMRSRPVCLASPRTECASNSSGPYQRKVKCHPWNSAAVSGPRRRSGPLWKSSRQPTGYSADAVSSCESATSRARRHGHHAVPLDHVRNELVRADPLACALAYPATALTGNVRDGNTHGRRVLI